MLLRQLAPRLAYFPGSTAATLVSAAVAASRVAAFASTAAPGEAAGQDHTDRTYVSPEEVKSIAELACIDLEKAGGVERMQADMGAMLRFVSVMDGVCTEGVEPMWSPLEADVTSVLREDVAETPTVSGPDLLKLAAKSHAPYYIAPKDDAPQH